MRFNPVKPGFLKSREFKVFLTVWIVYVFYLQMVGQSHMAINQSALTAAIVNEGRFEIDTYYRAAAGGVSFYNGHYYSIQAPGISFISVPFYILAKPVFYFLPQNTVDYLFENIESYGETLPVDYLGNKKIPSNYFPDIDKRQILEYLIISGFVLPVFTTPVFSAITAVLLYSVLGSFTRNEKFRLLITSFYAFGTLLFPLSTEFFERPIAIAFMFAAFVVLFKVRHKELKPEGSVIFAAGILAGLSAWFDYFHLFVAGLLFLYLLSSYIKNKSSKGKDINRFWIFDLNKPRLSLLLKFIIGFSIAVFPMFLYYYLVFDNPFTQSYAYSVIPESVHKVSDIFNMKFPSVITLLHMSGLFLYSPIILFALYGIYKALLKKDGYHPDAVSIAIFGIFTLIYASVLSFVYPEIVAPSFKRYMAPILPFIFIFMPYIFNNNALPKGNKLKILFIGVGIISILLNWTAAQYGGHQGLVQYDISEKRFVTGIDFLQNGPSSSFFRLLEGVFGWNGLLLNLIGLSVLAIVIFLIWRHYFRKNHDF
ncbi:hypothetical protein HYU50_00665 [Candidatus Woesearchaeota archaeon]|nr:hypothetical protein [Candidatus Woesearchaeota archaeon]